MSYEKAAGHFMLRLGGQGGPAEVVQETDTFISNRVEMERLGDWRQETRNIMVQRRRSIK